MTAERKPGEILTDWIYDRLSYQAEADAPAVELRREVARFYLASDFGAVPGGAFIQPDKFKAYSSPALAEIYDADTAGAFFKIGLDGQAGTKCQEHSYAQGAYGMGSQYYQLKLGPCCAQGQPLNVEWDWKFLPGADILDNASGKIAPAIQVGKISGPDSGTRMMVWFSSQGSNAKTPKYTANMQDQRSGSQWVPGGQNYSPFNIQLDAWSHFRMQWLPGPEGFAQWWLDGEPWISCGPTVNNFETDSIFVDVTTFYGGGADNAPKNATSKTRLANLEIYLGDENPGPPPPPPELARDEGFTLTLAGVRYRMTGAAKLAPLDPSKS